MLAIAQQNPEKHLSIQANIEILDLIKELSKELEKIELPDSIKKEILRINKADNTFREVAKFLRYKSDMLSIGSAITGQIDKKVLPLRTKYGSEKE